MIPIDDHRPSVGGYLRRVTASWERFFFRPADPTTLCLMRVLAGILIVYTHLAYTRDLGAFFGKNAWVDLRLAQEFREDIPIGGVATDWEGKQRSLTLPPDDAVRGALLEWLKNLPSDRAQRRQALAYVWDNLPGTREGSYAGLKFAQSVAIQPKDEFSPEGDLDAYVFTPPATRQQRLDWLLKPPDRPLDKALMPQYLREYPEDYRAVIRRNLEAFVETLPRDPGKVARLLSLLAEEAATSLPKRRNDDPVSELERTLQYVDRSLPDEPGERASTLQYLSRWSVDPKQTYDRGLYTWSVFYHVTNPTAMMAIHVCSLIVMVLFALGVCTRLTSILTWVAAMNYFARGSEVLFGMDAMMNIAMIYLMIAPCGATLSLDRWWAKKRARRQLEAVRARGGDTRALEAFLAAPQPYVAANLATRLFQIHFCFIYMASGLSKLKGPAWWSHTAIWSTMANPEFSPTVFRPYRWFLVQLAEHRWLWELVMSFGGYFTLILEIGLPFLIWRPRLRPYVVTAAVLFHTGIATVMGLAVFSLFMMVLLMSYIPPEVVRYWIEVRGGKLFNFSGVAAKVPPPQRQVVVSS